MPIQNLITGLLHHRAMEAAERVLKLNAEDMTGSPSVA